MCITFLLKFEGNLVCDEILEVEHKGVFATGCVLHNGPIIIINGAKPPLDAASIAQQLLLQYCILTLSYSTMLESFVASQGLNKITIIIIIIINGAKPPLDAASIAQLLLLLL